MVTLLMLNPSVETVTASPVPFPSMMTSPVPEPRMVTERLMMICSRYRPGFTRMTSPIDASSMASWIVG
jgi:hypothetical protein